MSSYNDSPPSPLLLQLLLSMQSQLSPPVVLPSLLEWQLVY
jgi:hypothetical protein